MNDLKDLSKLLMNTPGEVKWPELGLDLDGGLCLEWYYGVNNLLQLTLPIDGTEPYITYYTKKQDGVEYDLDILPQLLSLLIEESST